MTTGEESAPTSARRALRRVASSVRPALLRLWRADVRRRSTDVTADAPHRSALVLAPHPDDETLGCGALIARKRAAGTEVEVVVVTDGRLSHVSAVVDPDELARRRRDESVAACAVLGLDRGRVHHLDLPEGTVGERHDDVVAALVEHIERTRPDDVLVTSALDWHVDHRALALAARAAVARVPQPHRPRLLEYPVWAWADGPWSDAPGRTAVRAAVDLVVEPVRSARGLRPVHVRTTADLVGTKRRAMAAYVTQTTNVTGEAGWAVMDGTFLEQFMGQRETFFRSPTGGAA